MKERLWFALPIGAALVVACSGSTTGTDLSGNGNGSGKDGKDPFGPLSGSSSSGSSGTGGDAGTKTLQSGSATAACNYELSSNAACNSCENQSCCAELNACKASQECSGYATCMQQCDYDPSCRPDCAAQYPNGGTIFDRAVDCITQKCGSACQ